MAGFGRRSGSASSLWRSEPEAASVAGEVASVDGRHGFGESRDPLRHDLDDGGDGRSELRSSLALDEDEPPDAFVARRRHSQPGGASAQSSPDVGRRVEIAGACNRHNEPAVDRGRELHSISLPANACPDSADSVRTSCRPGGREARDDSSQAGDAGVVSGRPPPRCENARKRTLVTNWHKLGRPVRIVGRVGRPDGFRLRGGVAPPAGRDPPGRAPPCRRRGRRRCCRRAGASSVDRA